MLKVDYLFFVQVKASSQRSVCHLLIFLIVYDSNTCWSYCVRPSSLAFQIFEGNTDHFSVKKISLKQPVITRFVRFCPLEWHVSPCMSVEIYGAPATEQGNKVFTNVKVCLFA